MTAQEERDPHAWRVFQATGVPPKGKAPSLPKPPAWRRFAGGPALPEPPADEPAELRRLGRVDITPHLDESEVDTVNAALLLRRPLLVTGPPGVGKSTLAYLIARELGLGRVLSWNIVSRTSLRDGLYAYDAIGRAQAIAAWRAESRAAGPDDSPRPPASPESSPEHTGDPADAQHRPPTLGDFITLGPLGTALLPYDRPRVLLVDELDKSDIDLPNDLLHALENGSYEIAELARDAADTASVHTDDLGGRADILRGRVECRQFPIVVITSNGEREFPAAFRRRCLPLEMRMPGKEQLLAIVRSHLEADEEQAEPLVDQFLQRVQGGGTHSLDQLLNAVQLTTMGGFQADGNGRKLVESLLRDLAKGR
ncbi:AAA family ATPase [Streptomyces himalayensis]|uniref:AAA family ATPase n=1 Tax=Streptomyces himalayensis subsp. himalayensis TaxID=2756131 RepID=A0A7W0DM12_9ACTN|nr:AAA family ATPase [Streptomyces himalayensis]MBA2947579.1 AAA family ATPase [Streptomyces himalayensis subsp. himalayensis]